MNLEEAVKEEVLNMIGKIKEDIVDQLLGKRRDLLLEKGEDQEAEKKEDQPVEKGKGLAAEKEEEVDHQEDQEDLEAKKETQEDIPKSLIELPIKWHN